MKRSVGLPIVIFLALMLVPGIAQAHTVHASGQARCNEQTGEFVVAWSYNTTNVPPEAASGTFSAVWSEGNPTTYPGSTHGNVSNMVTATWDYEDAEGRPHHVVDTDTAYVYLNGECEAPEEPVPATASVSFSCALPDRASFEIIAGTLAETFTVAVTNPGQLPQVYPGSAIGTIPAHPGDQVTIVGSISGLIASFTIGANACGGGSTPPPPPPPPCEPDVLHGPWYGDPRINITLIGPGDFVIRGGVQRFSGLHVIRVNDLACDEQVVINRYKVRNGYFLRVYEVLADGTESLMLRLQAPRV